MARGVFPAGGLLVLATLLYAPAAVAQAPPGPTETQPAAPATQPADESAAAPPPAGPPAPAPGRPRNILDVRLLAAELGFELRYDRRETTYPYMPPVGARRARDVRQVDSDFRLLETLALRSAGAIGGEQWVLYDAMVRYGLGQERYTQSGPQRDQDQSPNGDLFEYDVALTIFPRGKVSGSLYAQRLDSRIPRAFLPSLDRTFEKYGAGLFLNDATFPMRFTFEHVWDELTSRVNDLDDDEQRGYDTFRYEGTWQSSPHHALRLEYEYTDEREVYSGSDTEYDTTRHYVLLNDTLRFGAEKRSSLESVFRYLEETGELGHDNLEFSERLRLYHSRNLQSTYAFQYLRDRFQMLENETWRGEAGLNWQIRDGLLATFQLYGLTQNSEWNSGFCEIGGTANLSLTRDNRYGRFSANATYNHTSTTTDNSDSRGIVIAESVTLRDPLPSFLAQTYVDPLSIIVTDANRTRTYLPVRDYIVIPLGQFTAIERIPTGAIVDGETVLVTYTYRVLDNYRIQRDRLDFRVQQEFNFGLTPYYAASMQNETVSEQRFLPYRERDIQRHRLGATFRRPRWSVGGEYEYNDDAVDPYQALRGNGDWVILRNARGQLDGRVDLSYFDFWGAWGLPARAATLLDIGADYRYVLARDLEFVTAALYRFEHDTSYGDRNGVDLTAALDWRIGYFTMRFEIEYDMLNLPGSDQDNLALWLKLRRDIPIINRPGAGGLDRRPG